MNRPNRTAGTALAIVAAAITLMSCGGSDTKPGTTASRPAYDADALVKHASGPTAQARSGVIDGSLTITIDGVPKFADPVVASVSGPFQYRAGAALPDYHLQMGVRDYGLDLISVRGKSYASLSDTGYELPAPIRRRLVTKSGRGANGLTRTLEQFGIAPWRWETDRRVGATEPVDGVDTVRIDTSFNAGRILNDANTLLGVLSAIGVTRATGLPPQLPHGARRLIVGSVTSKVGASWIGVHDRLLHRSAFTMIFKVPKADQARLGGITGGKVVGRLHVTELGRPQHIAGPRTVAPYAELQLALKAVGDAQG